MEYTVDYFIEKFEKIPDYLWCMYEYTEGDKGELTHPDRNKHCSLGHCGQRIGNNTTPESIALNDLLSINKLSYVTAINDGLHKDYQQPTPKQRILAALRDIKNKN